MIEGTWIKFNMGESYVQHQLTMRIQEKMQSEKQERVQ